jgi:transcriptional regulator with XRE-family HTH domain
MARRRSFRRIQIGVRVAAIVRDAREAGGISMTELGVRSGVSRQMVAAVESAQANPSLDVIAALFDGLGIDVDLVARGRVMLDRPRRGDAAHAMCSAYVQRRLEAAGWQVAREVRIDDGRYVGWIDLLAFHAPTGTLLVIEVKTQIEDLGAIERSIDWHVRGARRAAERLGWRARAVAAWVTALASDEIEEELRRNRALWESAFPRRAREMALTASAPEEIVQGRGLALIDPRSRRRDWLIRARVDGRRSPPPYRGYADFMGHVRRRS